MIWLRALSSVLAAAGLLFIGQPAYADDAVIENCLNASAASFQSDNLHHLRAERAELLVCAAADCPTEIRKECTRRVEEVTLAIPTVVFEARDAAGNDLSAVAVSMDGEALSDRLDGFALSVDPGAHTFTFAAKGQPSVQKQFVIRQGQKDRHERITIGEATPRLRLSSSATPIPAPEPERREPAAGLGPQKVWAIAVAGLGVAGVAVGAVFGADAISKRDEAKKACPAACADLRGVELWHDAKNTGNRATVAFVAGGALLAVSGLLWLTAPGEPEVRRIELGLGPGTLVVRREW